MASMSPEGERKLRELIQHPDRDVQPGAAFQLADLEEFDPAEEVLNERHRRAPEDLEVLLELAQVTYAQQRLEDALELFDRCLARDPEFARAHRRRAQCLRELWRLEEAIEAYRRYLQAQPKDAEVWVGPAVCCSDLDRFDDARAAFDRALRLDSALVSAHFNLAITAFRQNDAATVRRCSEALSRIAPDDWMSKLIQVYALEMQGEAWRGWELVRATWEEQVEVEDPMAPYVSAFALWYAQRNGPDAGELIDRILERDVVDEEVPAALRAIRGPRVDAAQDFEVKLDGVWAMPPSGRSVNYQRVVRVPARGEDEARAMATELETQRGGRNFRATAVRGIGEVPDPNLGVWTFTEALVSVGPTGTR